MKSPRGCTSLFATMLASWLVVREQRCARVFVRRLRQRRGHGVISFVKTRLPFLSRRTTAFVGHTPFWRSSGRPWPLMPRCCQSLRQECLRCSQDLLRNRRQRHLSLLWKRRCYQSLRLKRLRRCQNLLQERRQCCQSLLRKRRLCKQLLKNQSSLHTKVDCAHGRVGASADRTNA